VGPLPILCRIRSVFDCRAPRMRPALSASGGAGSDSGIAKKSLLAATQESRLGQFSRVSLERRGCDLAELGKGLQ
jgi:hypothetical protein